jgi:hypothetical protein
MGSSVELVKAVGSILVQGVEQMAVSVHGYLDGGVPQHLLNLPGVPPGLDRESHRRMPQVVDAKGVKSGTLCSWNEDPTAKGMLSNSATVGSAEDERIGVIG